MGYIFLILGANPVIRKNIQVTTYRRMAMRPEDVPEFFREQVKITKEHVGKFGVNNVFKKIDLSDLLKEEES